MQIVIMSDTHGQRPTVPSGDVLIHAGDVTHWGSFAEIRQEIAWLKSLPHKYKAMISGNHDTALGNLYEADKETQLRKFLHPIIYPATQKSSARRWKTFGSAYWYSTENLTRLIAGLIKKNEAATLHTFIRGFAGLSDSAHQVKEHAGLDQCKNLNDLVGVPHLSCRVICQSRGSTSSPKTDAPCMLVVPTS